MTFAILATAIALAAGVAVAVTMLAIVNWSDRRRAGLPAPLPSFVLALVLGLAVAAWAWTAPIWLPGSVYAIGVGWGLWLMVGDLRHSRWTVDSVPLIVAFVIGSVLWPLVAIGREWRRRREVAS